MKLKAIDISVDPSSFYSNTAITISRVPGKTKIKRLRYVGLTMVSLNIFGEIVLWNKISFEGINTFQLPGIR